MIVRPRPGFESAVRIADAVNPFIVILSIVGLFLEYTPLKPKVVPINQILDLIFVIDFLVRLICHRPLRYLIHGYGWVDFLASLPGLMLLLAYTPVFAIFKFVRIGRFFKIIRVLRFLRIFSFLKRMKSDSPWIQDRVMRIGIIIVMCFVVGIFFMDSGLKSALEDGRAEAWRMAIGTSQGDVTKAAILQPGLLFYRQGTDLRAIDGSSLAGGQAAWDAKVSDELHWFLEVPVSGGKVDAILVSADDLMARHDGLMLILLSTLVVLLLIVIFYLGAVFAQDMSGVHLIIDSVEADDLQLLKQEALRVGDGSLDIQRDENEMTSLIKVVARLGDSSGGEEAGGLSLTGLGLGGSGFAAFNGDEHRESEVEGHGESAEGDSLRLAEGIEALGTRLDRIEERLSASDKRLVVETARIITPAIVRSVKKILDEEVAGKA